MNGLWPRRWFQIRYGILSTRSCRFHPDDHKVRGRVSLIARASLALSSSFVAAFPDQMLPEELGCGFGMTCWRRRPRDWQRASVWDLTIPAHPDALAATDQNVPPEPAYASTEDAQLSRVTWNGVVSVGPCLTRAAEPPADQFGTLALPAHSQRESRRLGGRHRPAPEFPDHWAGSRTETI